MTAMEQISQIRCDSRAQGLSYGEYVRLHRPKYEREPEKQTRTCKTCGKEFTPKIMKNGEVSKKKNCDECTAAIREKNGLAPAHHFTKIYITRCAKCGCKIETRRAPGKGQKNYCEKCRKEHAAEITKKWREEHQNKYMRQYRKKNKGVVACR